MKDNFTPSFKENNEDGQFYWDGSKWVACGEPMINELWQVWVSHDKADRFEDSDGFLIYGFKTN